MERRILFIGGGALVLIVAAVLVGLSVSGRESTEPVDENRLNTLALAREYLSDEEFQRALDLVDRLLINDTSDEEARALRDEVVAAKRQAAELAREESRREQEELKETIAEMKSMSGRISLMVHSMARRVWWTSGTRLIGLRRRFTSR